MANLSELVLALIINKIYQVKCPRLDAKQLFRVNNCKLESFLMTA
jgi:hypothetical protein